MLQHGVLLLDKAAGLSSHQASQKIKRLFSANKVGHAGTLDPLATGLLPICINEAVKFVDYAATADKQYEALVFLGTQTSTGDRDGEIIRETTVPNITKIALEQCLSQFIGETEQLPPMYSALKYNGRPLYAYAREGKTVERKMRKIRIYALDLQSFDLPFFKIKVHCSKGTYIRSLVEDIAVALGCAGHLYDLRRIAISGLAGKMYALDALLTATPQTLLTYLLPTDVLLQALPRCMVDEAGKRALYQGKILEKYATDLSAAIVRSEEDVTLVALYEQDVFFGVGYLFSNGNLKTKRLLRIA